MKHLQVIAPVFNESEAIDEFVEKVNHELKKLSEYETSMLLVENGSTDDSFMKIKLLEKKYSNLKSIKLSRNFGMDGGLLAGISNTNADLVILMASDLQDDPAYFREFLDLYEKGFDNVYGIVKRREGTNPIRRLNSQLFYSIIYKLSDSRIPKNASDYRLLSKKAYKALLKTANGNFVFRTSVPWIGFRSSGIEIIRPPRKRGISKANTKRVLGIALKAILSNSYAPLRFTTILGFTLSGVSLLSLIATSILFIFRGVPFPGFGTIVSLSLLLFGLTFLFLGIISEYLALVYEEVRKRPNFIIDNEIEDRKL